MKNHEKEIKRRGVVIGYDHRHNSKAFADLTAKVFLSENIPVWLSQDIVATPITAYATKKLHTFCGIMITASHNPKNDNGYKLYWENGAQLVSPFDKYIADSIEENRQLWPAVAVQDLGSVSYFYHDILDSYMRDFISLLDEKALSYTPSRRIVYTPMHGVGLEFAKRIFETARFPPFIVTPTQAMPDPEFPTVTFPNPEEKGAFVRSAGLTISHLPYRSILG
jgi:phosphomannomutase